MKTKAICKRIAVAVLAGWVGAEVARAQSADALIHKLVEKGILTDKEAQDLRLEAGQPNLASVSKWKINDAFKNITLFGDVRFRYEYRGVDNPPNSGASGDTLYRERFRYALRAGIRGDLFDSFYYGLRLETSANPRSPWATFGDDSNGTPSSKSSDGIHVGQVYLGWRPNDWFDFTVGRMPMPLYVTPMIWDSDIQPEGFSERFKYAVGKMDLFANFGQFLYQDTNPDYDVPSSDTFLLAWQIGANVKLPKEMSFKVAPVVYNYTGVGQGSGLNRAYSGQGLNGLNPNTAGYNQNGINNLLILETPAEFNFKVGRFRARVFGDFAYNFEGADRARAAVSATAAAGGLTHAYTEENKAYQAGFGFGTLDTAYGPTAGIVYGSASKRGTWEARTYWQHVEQYAADVNLLDSDFFEGRANLEGVYVALAYCLSDGIIATFRYGYANRINQDLGTGGNNPDLSNVNPVRNYNLLQFDVTWRF